MTYSYTFYTYSYIIPITNQSVPSLFIPESAM